MKILFMSADVEIFRAGAYYCICPLSKRHDPQCLLSWCKSCVKCFKSRHVYQCYCWRSGNNNRKCTSQSKCAGPGLSVTCSGAVSNKAGRGRKRRKFSAFLTGRDNHPMTHSVEYCQTPRIRSEASLKTLKGGIHSSCFKCTEIQMVTHSTPDSFRSFSQSWTWSIVTDLVCLFCVFCSSSFAFENIQNGIYH